MKLYFNNSNSTDAGDGSAERPFNCLVVDLDRVLLACRELTGRCEFYFDEGTYTTSGIVWPQDVWVRGMGVGRTTFVQGNSGVFRGVRAVMYQPSGGDQLSTGRFEGFTIVCGVQETGPEPLVGLIAEGHGIVIREVDVMGSRGNFSAGLECFALAATSRKSGTNEYLLGANLPNTVSNCRVFPMPDNEQAGTPYTRPYAYVTAILNDSPPGAKGVISECRVDGRVFNALVHAAFSGSSVGVYSCSVSSVRSLLNQDTYDVQDIAVSACVAEDSLCLVHADQTANWRIRNLSVMNNQLRLGALDPGNSPVGIAYLGGCDDCVIAGNTMVVDEIPANCGIVHWAEGNKVVMVRDNVVIADSGTSPQSPTAWEKAKSPLIRDNTSVIGGVTGCWYANT